MLTEDKTITQPDYWNKIYSGNNNDAKVDASNTKRVSTFDRFDIVVRHVNPGRTLDIGSGHAHICKRLHAKYPNETIIASDQSVEAKNISGYSPYLICSAYDVPIGTSKYFTTVICTQALEYMDDQHKFLTEAKRLAKYFICTVPDGEMDKWSQLRIYTEDNLKELLEQYGKIEVFEKHPGLLLAKIKFYE
jgi:ubiquinone/menaquinone biosynthesis C-methylase UbiE